MSNLKPTLSYEEGWPVLQKQAINKLILLVEGNTCNQFTSQETVYDICDNNPADPEAHKLYLQYKKTMEDYVSSKVVPSIRGKQDDILLYELVERWNNHKIMTRWHIRFFHYLERYLVPKRSLPSLQETSYFAFYELAYGEMNDQVIDAVISLLAMIAKDFEESMLKDAAVFYCKKASDWIASKSYEDYMLKVEECLKHEEGRVQSYLKHTAKKSYWRL